MNWRRYWNQLAAAEADPQRQVARVRANQDLGPDDPARVVRHLCQLLELRPQDRLLDLCCGNGLLTVQFATHCQEVAGMDLAEKMIESAQKLHSAPNIRYLQGNVTHADQWVLGPFDKIVLQFSFQYLSLREGKQALQAMKHILKPDGIIVLGDIPDADMIRSFYPALTSLIRYRIQRLLGTDQMGKFWSPREIKHIASGMAVERLLQPEDLPYSDYRVDYRLRFS